MQNRKTCCVIAKKNKTQKNIRNAMHDLRFYEGQGCDFQQILPAEHEFDGEKFCILHLPLERIAQNLKQKKLLDFKQVLSKSITKFNFIQMDGIEINDKIINNGPLTFCGSEIKRLSIKDSKIEELCFSYSRLNGGTNISC